MLLPVLLATLMLPTMYTPAVEFTNDSVYVNEAIIEMEPIAREDSSETYHVDIALSQNHFIGYAIYDIPETPYIDGIRFDDQYVEDWYIEDVDVTVEHVLKVKTVYSDDYAGMVLRAKAGDWGALFENPENIAKLIYYVIAAISIIISGTALFRSKKWRVKNAEEIASSVDARAQIASDNLIGIVTGLMDSTSMYIEQQRIRDERLIKALIIGQDGSIDSRIAQLEMLNQENSASFNKYLSEAKAKLLKMKSTKEQAVADAKKAIENIIESKPSVNTEDDGTSI